MNLAERLIKADSKVADELETGIFKSKRLAKIIGSEADTVDVVIREIQSRRLNDIVSYQVDKKGKVDFSKSFDAKLMSCVEGCVDPDLTNKELQAHFGCKSARDLAEKLFHAEVNAMSDAIAELSGIDSEEDMEEEIKN